MVLGMCFLATCGKEDTPKERAPTASSPATQQAVPSPGRAPRVIEITEAFIAPHFRPDPIVLKVGEPVQFKVTSADTRHTFIIEALGIDVEVPQKSLNETVTTKVVTPQVAGTFHVFCRIHERLPMEGSIEVTATGAAGQ
jgi:plastocyanin